MAKVIITLRIMPSSIETNLKDIEGSIIKAINDFGGETGKIEIEPIAFGLKALKIFFLLEESKGSTEALEDKIRNIKGVESCEVIDVRRSVG